jgi:uncharacterized protein HemX
MSEIRMSSGGEGPGAGQVVVRLVASLAIAGLFAFLLYMVVANWLQIGALQESTARSDQIAKNLKEIADLKSRIMALEEKLAKPEGRKEAGRPPRLEGSHTSFNFTDDAVREWWVNRGETDEWWPRR